MKLKNILTGAAAASIFTVAPSFAAEIVIDDFLTAQQADSNPATALSSSTEVTNGSFIGEDGRTRTLTVENFTGPSNGGTRAGIGAGGAGFLDFDNGARERGTVLVDYDFAGMVDLGDGGFNDQLVMDFAFADAGEMVMISVTDSDSTFSVDKFTGAESFTGQLAFAFSEFSGIDFSDVVALSFSLTPQDGVLGADASINLFASSSEVPIPGAAPLLLSGLAGLGFMRSRKKR